MGERGAAVISWGGQQPGVPNNKGLEVFAKALGYYDELAKEGRITGYRVFASTTRSKGILVIEGDVNELAKINLETQSLQLLALADAVVQDVEVDIYRGGSADDATQYYLTGLQAVQEMGLGQ